MKGKHLIVMLTGGLSALGGCMAGDDPGAGVGEVEATKQEIWTTTVRSPNTGSAVEILTTSASSSGSGPSAAQWGTGKTVADQNIDIFWRGSNNHLMHTWWQSEAWWVEEDFGDIMASASQPAVTSRTNNIRDVFWRGSNNHLMHKWYQNGWSGAQDLGSTLASSPAAMSWGTSALHVFWKGSNGNVQWKSMDYATNTWTDRSDIVIPAANKVSSDPAAIYRNNGIADIFWQGPNNRLEHIWSTDGKTWSWVQEFGVSMYSGSSPTATRRANGEVHVFWRDTNDHLQYIWMDAKNNWSAVTDALPTPWIIASSPAATSWSSKRLDVFALDKASGKMGHKLWSENAHVDVIGQETGSWCWAATGQMIMRFWGKEVAQCTQAGDQPNSPSPKNCCVAKSNPPRSNGLCDSLGGLPYWNKYGFQGTWMTNTGSVNPNAASLDDIKGQVALGRPWEHEVYPDPCTNPSGCGGHSMVGVDEFRFNGDDWIVVNNPDGTGQYMLRYSDYLVNPYEHNKANGDQFITKCAHYPKCP